jgi:predicted transcriptional regulator
MDRAEGEKKMVRIEPRSRWEIILDILKVIEVGEGRAKKTRIMQNAYLDWRNFQRHFGFLQDQGFIRALEDSKGGTSYYLTKRGIDLMGRLEEVEKMLK